MSGAGLLTGNSALSQDVSEEGAPSMNRVTYQLTLHRTYFEKGFFNLGVAVDDYVGCKDGPIVLRLSGSPTDLACRVDRRANLNHTPRIHGGAALRDWFQQHFSEGETVEVVIESPRVLVLQRPSVGAEKGASV